MSQPLIYQMQSFNIFSGISENMKNWWNQINSNPEFPKVKRFAIVGLEFTVTIGFIAFIDHLPESSMDVLHLRHEK